MLVKDGKRSERNSKCNSKVAKIKLMSLSKEESLNDYRNKTSTVEKSHRGGRNSGKYYSKAL